jgi:hypothetical protein
MSLMTPVQLQTTRVIIFVANLNRRRFAAYRKRDEKSQRRDDQPGNLPFINCVTGSGRE